MIDGSKYKNLMGDKAKRFKPVTGRQDVLDDIDKVLMGYKAILHQQNLQFISTWLLDIHLLHEVEVNQKSVVEETLSRGRVVHVNPGADNLGREQRFVHPYIVLGEFKGTFIGVPITNMAKNKQTEKYYTRNVFEVELVDPPGEEKYTEYRCRKKSVADVRNIRGLDKRRISQDPLYETPRFAPNLYLDAISDKIKETIAQPSK